MQKISRKLWEKVHLDVTESQENDRILQEIEDDCGNNDDGIDIDEYELDCDEEPIEIGFDCEEIGPIRHLLPKIIKFWKKTIFLKITFAKNERKQIPGNA